MLAAYFQTRRLDLPAVSFNSHAHPSFRGMLSLLLGLLLIVVAGGLNQVRAADDQMVGFVLKISGDWIIVGPPPVQIAAGDKLPEGVVVRPAKGAKDPYMLLCLFDGSTLRCEAERTLPNRNKESISNRIWSAVMGRYKGSIVEAASRGDEMIANGIVTMADEKVDLAPLLQDLPDGEWSLQLRPLSASDPKKKSAEEAQVLMVNWVAGKTAVVHVSGLKPGLRELQVYNARTRKGLGNTALVYFCSPQDYPKLSASFNEAVQITKSWSESDRYEAATPFLQAFLRDLADKR